MANRTADDNITPKGYQQIADVSTPAKTLTVPAGANQALIIPLTQAVRWRDDGTDASATVGMPAAADTPFWYIGDLTALTFFEQVAGAELNISYYEVK